MAETIAESQADHEVLDSDTATIYRIGDDNCRINQIVQLLKPENSTNYDRKLIDIAIDLGISGETIERWRREQTLGHLSNNVLLFELLNEIRSKYASEATLQKFIDALCKKDLHQEAANLGAQFGINVELDKKLLESRTNKDSFAKVTCGVLLLLTITIVAVFFLVTFQNKNGSISHESRIATLNADELNNTAYIWATNIINNNYSEIHSILLSCEVTNKTTFLLSNSVDAAYDGNINNFQSVSKFVRKIHSPRYQYIGYTALQTAMHSEGHDHSKEMMKLVYFVKTNMQNESIGAELHTKYTELFNRVPKIIHVIMFKQCVLIRNIYYNEYLYLSDVPTAKSQRLVMTWIGEVKKPSKFLGLSWFFEACYENDELFFHIRSYNYEDQAPICPSSEYFDDHSRKTVGCPPDDQDVLRWLVEPLNGSFYFTIKSPDRCILYSPNNKSLYDHQHRYAFTWATNCNDNVDIPSYYWDISRCPV